MSHKTRQLFMAALCCIGLFVLSSEAVRYPLKISSNGRYLVDQDNVPFLYTGDTAWRLFLGATRADAELFMNDRLSKKYNAIQVILLPWNDNDTNQYGQKALSPPGSLSSPNPAYFDHVDWVISKAAEKKMAVAIVVAWLHDYKVKFREQGPAACRSLGRYLGKRYKHFDNIIWVMGGDDDGVDPYMVYEREIVAGIKENDTRHLVTYHNGDGPAQFPAEPWVDLWSNYTYGGPPYNHAYAYDVALQHYHRTPVRPSIFTEGYYEGATADPVFDAARLRAQAWWHLLSGGAGQAVGVFGVWYVGPGWQKNLQSPGMAGVTHLVNLLAPRQWYRLVPDDGHCLVSGGYGTRGKDDHVAAARTDDGRLGLAYIPPTGAGPIVLSVNMAELSGAVSARWFDPATGACVAIGSYPSSGRTSFTTPGPNGSGWNDWVLVLESVGVSGRLP